MKIMTVFRIIPRIEIINKNKTRLFSCFSFTDFGLFINYDETDCIPEKIRQKSGFRQYKLAFLKKKPGEVSIINGSIYM